MKYLLLILMAQGAEAKPLTAKEALRISNSYNAAEEKSLETCMEHIRASAGLGERSLRYMPGPCGDSVLRDSCGQVFKRLESLGYKVETSSVKPETPPIYCSMCCTTITISWGKK